MIFEEQKLELRQFMACVQDLNQRLINIKSLVVEIKGEKQNCYNDKSICFRVLLQ